VKAAGVLRKRYGRVYVTFDEPISLADHLRARGVERETATEEGVRGAVQALGHRIVYGINRSGVVTAVTLVCASLLGFRRRGIDEELLVRGAVLMAMHLKQKPEGSVRFQPGLLEGDVEVAARAALERLVADGLIVKELAGDRTLYRGAPDAGLELDAQKNQLLHHLVPECILACAASACGVRPGEPRAQSEVALAARTLSRVLKLELIFEVGKTYDELFAAALEMSQRSGLLALDGSQIALPPLEEARMARRYARNLVLGFVEAYHALFEIAAAEPALDDKALVLRALGVIQGKLAAGELLCAEAASKVTLENAAQIARQLRASNELADVTALLRRARPRGAG
jgi:glycerol-3-phosphate O-acyltransferase